MKITITLKNGKRYPIMEEWSEDVFKWADEGVSPRYIAKETTGTYLMLTRAEIKEIYINSYP